MKPHAASLYGWYWLWTFASLTRASLISLSLAPVLRRRTIGVSLMGSPDVWTWVRFVLTSQALDLYSQTGLRQGCRVRPDRCCDRRLRKHKLTVNKFSINLPSQVD